MFLFSILIFCLTGGYVNNAQNFSSNMYLVGQKTQWITLVFNTEKNIFSNILAFQKLPNSELVCYRKISNHLNTTTTLYSN